MFSYKTELLKKQTKLPKKKHLKKYNKSILLSTAMNSLPQNIRT